MIAMQYTFHLSDDYDMNSLRARVADRGPLFDRMEGLYQKAFLISEKGIHGASGNRYAPFYFWRYADAMSKFLVGDQFRAVSQAFGRPEVKSWLPLYFASGKAKFEIPTFATEQIIEIPPEIDLENLRAQQYKLSRQWSEHPENQSSFIGFDAHSWKMVRFALWTRPQENLADHVEGFEVVHLAAPGLDPNYFAAAAC